MVAKIAVFPVFFDTEIVRRSWQMEHQVCTPDFKIFQFVFIFHTDQNIDDLSHNSSKSWLRHLRLSQILNILEKITWVAVGFYDQNVVRGLNRFHYVLNVEFNIYKFLRDCLRIFETLFDKDVNYFWVAIKLIELSSLCILNLVNRRRLVHVSAFFDEVHYGKVLISA